MKLANDRQLRNTQAKLAEAEALLKRKLESPTGSETYDLSVRSLEGLITQLRGEIAEYERAHQTA